MKLSESYIKGTFKELDKIEKAYSKKLSQLVIDLTQEYNHMLSEIYMLYGDDVNLTDLSQSLTYREKQRLWEEYKRFIEEYGEYSSEYTVTKVALFAMLAIDSYFFRAKMAAAPFMRQAERDAKNMYEEVLKGRSKKEKESIINNTDIPYKESIRIITMKITHQTETVIKNALTRQENKTAVRSLTGKKLKQIKNQLESSMFTNNTLMLNESNQIDGRENGYQGYRIGNVNPITDICQNMIGQYFLYDKRIVGLTAPPFHYRCKSYEIPATNEELRNAGVLK